MNTQQAIALIQRALPMRDSIDYIETHPNPKSINFKWMGDMYKLTFENMVVNGIVKGFLTSDDKSYLIQELIRCHHTNRRRVPLTPIGDTFLEEEDFVKCIVLDRSDLKLGVTAAPIDSLYLDSFYEVSLIKAGLDKPHCIIFIDGDMYKILAWAFTKPYPIIGSISDLPEKIQRIIKERPLFDIVMRGGGEFAKKADLIVDVKRKTTQEFSRRDHFAGLAMQALVSNRDWVESFRIPDDWDSYLERISSSAVDLADAIIKSLNEGDL